MPGLKDFLPQPPWEGPPIPSFLWKEIEYTSPPLELEADISRGVLYLHDLRTGITLLRICRIPEEVMAKVPTYGAVLDLAIAHPRVKTIRGKRFKKSPVFLDIYKEDNRFSIMVDDWDTVISVENVPMDYLGSLEKSKFTDITVGVTKL